MKYVIVLLVIFAGWFISFCLDCYWYGSRGTASTPARHIRDNQPPFHRDTPDNILWFLQISDIHLSVYIDPGRLLDLRTFIDQVVATIKPTAVFVTGDITDAKNEDQISSVQHVMEWKMYQDVINKSSLIAQGVPWIDIRGNHDAFDVPERFHVQNMYRRYSVHKETSVAFKWTHTTKYGQYSFVGVDACPNVGLKRPYNFFGVLHEEDLLIIEEIVEETRNDNLTILFTHYPSSFITTNYKRMRQIFSGFVAHLCGHLHTGGNYVSEMYARHPDGHIELELSDWKHIRRFRLLAIDHDIFSFTDTNLNKWPLILVTNPPNTYSMAPGIEPLGRIIHSTHIRILVFSPWNIISVQVSIDDAPYQPASRPSQDHPLYVLPWQPKNYLHGLHTLTVVAEDTNSNSMRVTETFSLDGTEYTVSRLARFILLTNHRSLGRMVFLCLWLLLIICLATSYRRKDSTSYLYYLSNNPSIFYPFFISLVYYGIGPWYVGKVLTDVYGIIFVHGILVGSHFIPGSLTYLHGIAEILSLHLPAMFLLNYLLKPKYQQSYLVLLIWILISCVMLAINVWGLYRVVYAYGWITLVISPGYFWNMLMVVGLIMAAIRKKRIHQYLH